MAARNGKSMKFQEFFKGQLEGAKERITAFEEEAETVLKGLIVKGKAQRKELEGLFDKLQARELKLVDPRTVKQLGKKANQAGAEVRKRLDQLQSKVVEATGVATRSQVKEINRELAKLSKKIDGLAGRKAAPRPDAHA